MLTSDIIGIGEGSSEAHSYEIFHDLLDLLGLIPGLGEPADLTNAYLYYKEGDYKNASSSLLAAFPIAGSGVTLNKWTGKVKGILKKRQKAKALNKSKEKPSGGVYRLIDEEGKIRRTGRTKNHSQRRKQHANSSDTEDLIYDEVFQNNDYDTQRGLEHLLYEANQSTANKENGGLNKIKAISDKNPKKQLYLDKAQDFLDSME